MFPSDELGCAFKSQRIVYSLESSLKDGRREEGTVCVDEDQQDVAFEALVLQVHRLAAVELVYHRDRRRNPLQPLPFQG